MMKLKKLAAIILAMALLPGCGCGSDAAEKPSSTTTSTATAEADTQENAVEGAAVNTESTGTQDASAAADAQDESSGAKEASAQDNADAENKNSGAKETSADESGASSADAVTEEAQSIEAGITEIQKYGNLVLSVSTGTMNELGYELGDMINVTVGDQTIEMPVGSNYSDVATGEPVCVCPDSKGDGSDQVILAINMANFAEQFGIAKETLVEEEPGFLWEWCDGYDENTPVKISLSEKQGYADELEYFKILSTRTYERSDYPDLTDAEYANFRAVNTTGMSKDTLYRSSSPVNPGIARNEQADAAATANGIRTVINMADSEEEMASYEGFGQTYCAQCDIVALNMTVDFFSEDFRSSFAKGIRYMGTHKGPYLVHCNEGKDRTGFAIAVIEALMGASAEEIKEDYMKTYCNFYGLEPGTDVYDRVSAMNIETSLAKAFGIPDIWADGVDLVLCAEKYMLDIGLTEDEIAAFKDNMSEDYGGLG